MSKAISREIGRLIGEIYDSAIDLGSLPQALASAAELVGADYAAIALGDRHSGTIFYHAAVPDVGGGSSSPLCATPWLRHVLEQEPGKLHGHWSLPGRERAAHMLNGELRGMDFEGGVSGNFLLKKSGYGYIGFCRAEGADRFTPDELAALELLLPHVRQAFEINRHLQERSMLHEVMRERYEQFSTGVVLLDQEGSVVFSNAWARRLFREPGGVSCENGRLSVAAPPESQKLERLVEHCIRTAHMKGVMNDGYLSVARGEHGKPPLAISVSSYLSNPDAPSLLARQSCVMVLLYDVERRNTTRRYVLEQLYNLTASEAQLATGLASGKTIKELAEAQGVSRETLRSQLKRVFQKTNTNRQSDLVKLVLTGPGSLVV